MSLYSMRVFRRRGLIAFLILLLLLTLAWYLLAPKIIANSIEDLGSEALGAKVEVANVDLTLFPLTVTINNFVAANPVWPMTNLIEFRQIKFPLDPKALLWKKIIIEKMTLNDLSVATNRLESGALNDGRKTRQVKPETLGLGLPDINKIDIKNLIDNSDLITLERIRALKQNQEKLQGKWQQALNKQAFDARIVDIQAKHLRLSNRAKANRLNFMRDRKKWLSLKKSVNIERDQLKLLSTNLEQDKQSLSNQLNLIKRGPNDDLEAIMPPLGFNPDAGLVDKHLDSQYTHWLKSALQTIKKLKLSKSTQSKEKEIFQASQQGYFTEQRLLPEFLVKRIFLDGNEQDWKLDSNVEKLFRDAINKKIKQQSQKLAGKIMQQITERVGDISTLEKFNTNFDLWQSQLVEKDELLQSLSRKPKR